MVSSCIVGGLLLQNDNSLGSGALLLGRLSNENSLRLSVYDGCLRLGHHVCALCTTCLQHVLARLRTGNQLNLTYKIIRINDI